MRFIYNDDLVGEVDAERFSSVLLQQQVIWQRDELSIRSHLAWTPLSHRSRE